MVLALRRQQVKNFCALLLLSNGIPMIVAGDEFLNTQRGNNNPYNQDNEITWLDWARLEQNRDVFRFFKLMLAFRKAHPSVSSFWRGRTRYGTDGPVDLGLSPLLAFTSTANPSGDGVPRDDQRPLEAAFTAYGKALRPAWRCVVGRSEAVKGIRQTREGNGLQNLTYGCTRVPWWSAAKGAHG